MVGGLEHEFYDFPYENVIIPTDELIFFRGVGFPHQPDTCTAYRRICPEGKW